MGWEGIGTAIGVIAEWFSPKKRIERLKNELGKLEQEKKDLADKPPTPERAYRYAAIDKRIAGINRMLKNAARD